MYLEKALGDQTAGWRKIVELKQIDLLGLRPSVAVRNKAEVFERIFSSIRQILSELVVGGMSFSNAEPGHALGHFVRDCLNAIRLAARLDADPKDLFIGVLGGVFHDVGCAFVSRYDEPNRLVRHAEASALILEQIFKVNGCDLNRAEQLMVEYCVAAHTHYLRPTEFKLGEKVYLIEPYRDEEGGKPILGVYFPRWVDRLECNGPTFVARHYITLAVPHKDFSGKEFFEVKFADHLRPLLRTAEEIKADGGKQTMLEHLNMFAGSQTNASPYGRHDYGAMVEMRDRQTARLDRVIAARGIAFYGDWETILRNWDLFLMKNIEPTESGQKAATALSRAFLELPEATQNAWINCFRATLSEYRDWGTEIQADFKQMQNQELLRLEEALFGIADIQSLISPACQFV